MTEETPIKKKRRWLRVLLWVLLTPVALFTLLMVLLYVPPVQNFLRRQATAIASEATGMDISVERIDLRFPLNLLVRGALVVQPADSTGQGIQAPDTLLDLGSLNVRIQAWPLLHGRVEVDHVTLSDVSVNSADLLEGMRVEGQLGRFFLKSHGVDLVKEEVVLNEVELEDSRVHVLLSDTTASEPEDTTSAPVKWKLTLQNLKLKTCLPVWPCRWTRQRCLHRLPNWGLPMRRLIWVPSVMAGSVFAFQGRRCVMMSVRDVRLKDSMRRTSLFVTSGWALIRCSIMVVT